jgi:hypothetical protein
MHVYNGVDQDNVVAVTGDSALHGCLGVPLTD